MIHCGFGFLCQFPIHPAGRTVTIVLDAVALMRSCQDGEAGGLKVVQLEIPQLTAILMTNAILVRPHMPIANGRGLILGYHLR